LRRVSEVLSLSHFVAAVAALVGRSSARVAL
jgi:hypothetical protein